MNLDSKCLRAYSFGVGVTCVEADHIRYQLVEGQIVIQWFSQCAVAKLQIKGDYDQVPQGSLGSANRNLYALHTACKYPPTLTHSFGHQRRSLGSIPKDWVLICPMKKPEISSVNVEFDIVVVETHWASAPYEWQQIATHRNQDQQAVKIQAASRGSGPGQWWLEERKKRHIAVSSNHLAGECWPRPLLWHQQLDGALASTPLSQ